eukprot:CAMPEP_0114494960 /NCGR_PEP_ID=MMETSP0109-20121206/4942_1 /TAXON_ID=29199 /ORGANISM="Chlorarachnion reptans, Strain CCCM449" /LENGTH=68 /DNA_ID=CAMNT_0001672055 /DNA_START=55 /DNA_END=261 /DNA_ORIENTATION=-
MSSKKTALTTDLVEKYVAENSILIDAIKQQLNSGKMKEAAQYQMKLQQNLIYLATIADVDPKNKKKKK